MSVLVQKGTLRVGDSFLCGLYEGRVRALLDERGHTRSRKSARRCRYRCSGQVVSPKPGMSFSPCRPCRRLKSPRTANVSTVRSSSAFVERGVKLVDFGALAAAGKVSTLPLVIKGDVDGSVQALSDSLEQLGTSEVRVEIIHRGVGAINESDVLLAHTAGAVIIGFRVRPQTAARQEAEREDVDIRVYDVVYEAVDEVTAALEGMLAPEKRETIDGSAEVREVFQGSRRWGPSPGPMWWKVASIERVTPDSFATASSSTRVRSPRSSASRTTLRKSARVSSAVSE